VFSHTHALLANMAGPDPAMAILQLQLCPDGKIRDFLTEAAFLS